MTEKIKKIGILIVLIISIPVLSSCDSLQSDANLEYNYLNISADNEYGIENIEPGLGRYRYEKGTVADIKLSTTEGYASLEWQGEDRGDVVKENGNYIIQLDEDKKIRAALELEEFKPLEIDFSGIEPFAYEEADSVTGVPHNLEEAIINFNNELYSDNELEIRIENVNSDESEDTEDVIEPHNIEIDENKVIISLLDWRERFYDEEEDSYLKFAEDYRLIVETPYDVDNREYQEEELVINFKVEEPYPEVPDNVRFDNDKSELSWWRSKTNAKIDLDKEEYVNKYIVYKFVGESNFEKKDADSKIEVIVDNPAEEDVIKKQLNIEEEEKIYYKVSAVNDYDNESNLSEVVEAN
ncbi:MAG: hypothetical protein ACOCQF_04715 [Halanaerobiaceae bacterium]